MKKIFIVTLVVALLLAGCAAGGAVKTGLGHDISLSGTKGISTDDEGNAVDGQAQVNTAMAAVTVDADGKILGVQIDNAQVKVKFDATGMVTTDTAVEQMTKFEKGADYGMIKASGIGREWFEQITALGEWMVGKTIDEVNAMKTYEKNEDHPMVPDEADLTSSVTIDVGQYLKAVTQAVANAK